MKISTFATQNNVIIMKMNIPITQSKSWHILQEDLGEKSYLVSKSEYHYLVILKNTPAGYYLYCPYGPCYDNREYFNKALESLISLAKEHHAIFIRIEPQDPSFKTYAPKNARKSTDLNPK